MNPRTVKHLKRLTRWTGPPEYSGMQKLAQLVTHIPSKAEQMVRYYGFYSNKSRGLRKKLVLDPDREAGTDEQLPIFQ